LLVVGSLSIFEVEEMLELMLLESGGLTATPQFLLAVLQKSPAETLQTVIEVTHLREIKLIKDLLRKQYQDHL